MNRENSMGVLLTDQKVLQKTWFRRFPGAETGVFTCFFLSMFSKPNFLHAFQEKVAALAAIHWATARPNRARTTAKTQGFVTKTRLHYVWQELENWSFTLPKHSQ